MLHNISNFNSKKYFVKTNSENKTVGEHLSSSIHFQIRNQTIQHLSLINDDCFSNEKKKSKQTNKQN